MRMVRRQSGAEDAECMRSKRDNRVRVCDQITCSPVWAALIPPFLQSDTGEPPNLPCAYVTCQRAEILVSQVDKM
jgi:hypothetical protein